ncbi:MAG: translocation protein TolB, partial [Cyclobacteriaceae bacterium]
MNKRIIFLLIFVLLAGFSSEAQQERNNGFGQNRVQHKDFDWYYYSSDKFDVYYYTGGRDYAKLALDYLNKEYNRITDVIGYAPFNKTTIFLYNSYTDLQQSNIGVDGAQFTIAGQTNFVKLQLEVAYPGSAEKFKNEITYKLTRILLDDMMFGGSLAERFQSAYLLSLANWFIEGAARYVTYGWSVEMDDYIRDFLARKKLRRLARIDDKDAGYIGQSIWNYIAIKYGSGNISNILNLTRYTRKEENSIGSTLGLRFQTFVYEWQNYYLQAGQNMEGYEYPNRDKIFAIKKNADYRFSQVRVNPAGKKVAYAVNYEGTYKVVIEDMETGKKTTVLRGGNRVLTQETNFNIPLIDWLNDQTIGFIYDKSGIFFIGSLDLETKEKFEKPLPKFDQIHDFSFNYNGKLAILSANTDKRNDLYLISMRRSATKRLTNDLYDDIHPRFIPGTDAIVFSSNRTSPFLDEAREVSSLAEIDDNLDLFIYDLDTTQNKLVHLTKTIGRDFYPYPQNNQTIFFLSDQKGNNNLYRYNLLDSTYTQVTKFNRSIREYDLNSVNDEFTYLMLDGGVQKIFLDKNFDLRKSNFTAFTPRQNVLQARALVKRIESRNKKEVKPQIINKDPLLPDSLMAVEIITEVDTARKKSDYSDADDFEFEEEAKFKNESLSFLSILGNLEAEPTVIGPLKYEPRFSMDNITTSFVIDPVRNFGILLEAGMSDLLENHKLYGGMLFMTDFKNGDLFGEYQYLKHRVDFKLRFDRRVFHFNPRDTDLAQKYSLNSVTVGASYPFNNAMKISFNPFFAFTNFTNLARDFVSGTPGVID